MRVQTKCYQIINDFNLGNYSIIVTLYGKVKQFLSSGTNLHLILYNIIWSYKSCIAWKTRKHSSNLTIINIQAHANDL